MTDTGKIYMAAASIAGKAAYYLDIESDSTREQIVEQLRKEGENLTLLINDSKIDRVNLPMFILLAENDPVEFQIINATRKTPAELKKIGIRKGTEAVWDILSENMDSDPRDEMAEILAEITGYDLWDLDRE